jgi:hypothetical protein
VRLLNETRRWADALLQGIVASRGSADLIRAGSACSVLSRTPQCRYLADTEGRYRRYVDADHFLSAPKAKRFRYRGRYEQQTQPAAVLWTLIDTSLPSGPRTTSEGSHSERTSQPANTDYQPFLSAKYGRCEGLARRGGMQGVRSPAP